MLSQHWFRLWLGALRQQAITWVNVDQVLCRHMASPGHNELTHLPLDKMAAISQTIFSDAFSQKNENFCILKLFPKGLINNNPALV